MPIYEFKCLKCDEFIEILVMGGRDDTVEMKCSKCGSEDLERILSTTSYSMAASGDAKSKASTENRTCSGGSCTTWNLPGHTR